MSSTLAVPQVYIPPGGGEGHPNFVIGFVKIPPVAKDTSAGFELPKLLCHGSKHRVNLWLLRKQKTVDINRRNM